MISRVLLVAIFGSVLYFEAEAAYPPKKCNEDDIRKVYTWWLANGGVPQHMTEHLKCRTECEINRRTGFEETWFEDVEGRGFFRFEFYYFYNNIETCARKLLTNVRCHPREVAVLSTPGFFDQEVTCAVMYHYAASHTIYYKVGENVTQSHEAVIFDWGGTTVEPLRQNIRLEIAEVDGMRLLHLCSRRSDAEVGPSEFMIKGEEGKVSEKGVKALQELLVKEFGVKDTLRKYSETCRLPFESEGTHGGDSHCSSGPCTHH